MTEAFKSILILIGFSAFFRFFLWWIGFVGRSTGWENAFVFMGWFAKFCFVMFALLASLVIFSQSTLSSLPSSLIAITTLVTAMMIVFVRT